MKNLIYLILLTSVAYSSCNPNEEETRLFITDLFNSHAQYTCTDSTKGNIQLQFLHYQLNMEKRSFEFDVPDSVQFSDFYNAYIGRIADTYYKSLVAQDNGNIDSLFLSPNCSVVEVKRNIIVSNTCFQSLQSLWYRQGRLRGL